MIISCMLYYFKNAEKKEIPTKNENISIDLGTIQATRFLILRSKTFFFFANWMVIIPKWS